MTEVLDTLIKYGQEFQTKCVLSLLTDRPFVEQSMDIVSPLFFESDANQWIVDRIIWYFSHYKALPTVEVLKRESDKIEKNDVLRAGVVGKLKEVFFLTKDLPDDLRYIKDELLTFCKNQSIKTAVLKSADLLQRGDYDSIKVIIDKAMHAGKERNIGHIWTDELEMRVNKIARNVIPTPWACINDLLDGGLGAGELGCWIAPSGCHAKGTNILMFNGSIKTVEDVIVGDVLMGANGTPRNVLRLVSGVDVMYRIIPTKGTSFVVNQHHLLSLKNAMGKIVNISVDDYLTKSNNFKNTFKLYRSDNVSFSSNCVLPIAPYGLGLLLGDGSLHTKNLSVTTMDSELVNEVEILASQHNCKINKFTKLNNKASTYSIAKCSGLKNELSEKLKLLNLFDVHSRNKFIPTEYKITSIENRLELLAGLIDTDGSLSNGTFDITFASEKLLDDVIFVSRSLGLAAYKSSRIINGTTYYRTNISGNINIIPTRLLRKRSATRKQIKNVLHTGFVVTKEPDGDFFGFTLDGDCLYLTDDFTVHHNCGKSWMLVALGAEAIREGKTVAHYTMELSETYVGLRYDTVFTGIEPNKIKDHKELAIEKIKGLKGKLFIKYFPTRSVTVNAISAHIQRLISLGERPDLIIVDYPDLMRSAEKADARHEELGFIYEELRGLVGELKIPCWVVSQSQRSASQDDVVEADKIAGAYSKIMACDVVLSVSRKLADKMTNSARVHIIKNRFGGDGIVFPTEMDLGHGKINILDENSPQGLVLKTKMQSGEGQIKAILSKKLIDTQSFTNPTS